MEVIEKFYKKYNGKTLQDNGSEVSKEYANFQNAFLRLMKSMTKEINANVVKSNKGHYFTSLFIERNNKYAYVYFSGNIYRRTHIELDNILYRTTKDDKDYCGGFNQYTNLRNLPKELNKLLG